LYNRDTTGKKGQQSRQEDSSSKSGSIKFESANTTKFMNKYNIKEEKLMRSSDLD
jgi:hypothetical protein